jgi:hypothetical protein
VSNQDTTPDGPEPHPESLTVILVSIDQLLNGPPALCGSAGHDRSIPAWCRAVRDSKKQHRQVLQDTRSS